MRRERVRRDARPRRDRRAIPLLFLLAAPLAGCYTFTPGSLDDVSPQERVRVRLSATEAERVEELLELEDARSMEGVYLGRQGEDVLVDVTISSEARGIRMESVRQRIDLRESSILEIETRELDRTRTGILAVAGAGGIVAAIAATSFSGRGEENGGDGDPGPEDRIPVVLFRLPFPW